MNANFKKSMQLTSSVLFALVALSSCGKSKDLKAEPPAQTTAAPVTPALANLPQASSQDQTPAQNRPQNIPPYNEGDIQPPGHDGPNNGNLDPQPPLFGPENDGPNGQPQNGQGRNGRGQNRPGQQFPNPQQNDGYNNGPGYGAGPYDDNGQYEQLPQDDGNAFGGFRSEAGALDFTNQVAVKTGGRSGDLQYTSAGNDGLMEEFKSYGAKVSADQQNKNNLLAKAIVSAKLSKSTTDSAMVLTLIVDEFGSLKTYSLAATEDGEKMKLSLASRGTTGDMAFQGGFLKCLDLDGDCQVSYAKIKFEGGYTRVIFRKSYAHKFFGYQENIANNAYSTWLTYILNAVTPGAPENQSIDKLETSSYEIVNGKAQLNALLNTTDGEALALAIPMVVSGRNSDVMASVAKGDSSKGFDIALEGNTGTRLSSLVGDIKLVNNNGLGQFRLQLKLGGASLWINASRLTKPTLSLDEVRQFESTLKAF